MANVDFLETEPPPQFQRRLVAASREKGSWRAACPEWTPVGFVEADGPEYDGPPSFAPPDFVDKCELCDHRLYRYNYVIWNEHTDKKFTIGSECIKRFDSLKGVSQGDVRTFVDQWTARHRFGPLIRRLANAFNFRPIDRQNFRDFCKVVRDAFGPLSTYQDWVAKKEDLLAICDVADGSVQADQIRSALLEPWVLPLTKRERRRTKEKTEDQLRRELYKPRSRKSSVENLTAGRSEQYKQNRLDR